MSVRGAGEGGAGPGRARPPEKEEEEEAGAEVLPRPGAARRGRAAPAEGPLGRGTWGAARARRVAQGAGPRPRDRAGAVGAGLALPGRADSYAPPGLERPVQGSPSVQPAGAAAPRGRGHTRAAAVPVCMLMGRARLSAGSGAPPALRCHRPCTCSAARRCRRAPRTRRSAVSAAPRWARCCRAGAALAAGARAAGPGRHRAGTGTGQGHAQGQAQGPGQAHGRHACPPALRSAVKLASTALCCLRNKCVVGTRT